MTPEKVSTISRIQNAMLDVEQEAHTHGMNSLDYVRVKELTEPETQDEYLHSLAELGIESDVSFDDHLSWSVDLKEIEETMAGYPVDKQVTLNAINQSERDMLKKMVTKSNSFRSNNKEKENGQSFELQ